jgi:hypothetical protein
VAQSYAATFDDRRRLDADAGDRPVHRRAPDLGHAHDPALHQTTLLVAHHLCDELVWLGEQHARVLAHFSSLQIEPART